MCFKEPEWKFLNEKHQETSKFYGLPKIHKSKIISSAMNAQNRGIIHIFEPNNLKLTPNCPKCLTGKLSQLLRLLENHKAS